MSSLGGKLSQKKNVLKNVKKNVELYVKYNDNFFMNISKLVRKIY